jgi:hypothetical protein
MGAASLRPYPFLPAMIIYPAIDLRGGRVVRLTEGKFDQEKSYGDDPLAVAKGFKAAAQVDGGVDDHGRKKRMFVLRTSAVERVDPNALKEVRAQASALRSSRSTREIRNGRGIIRASPKSF